MPVLPILHALPILFCSHDLPVLPIGAPVLQATTSAYMTVCLELSVTPDTDLVFTE